MVSLIANPKPICPIDEFLPTLILSPRILLLIILFSSISELSPIMQLLSIITPSFIIEFDPITQPFLIFAFSEISQLSPILGSGNKFSSVLLKSL